MNTTPNPGESPMAHALRLQRRPHRGILPPQDNDTPWLTNQEPKRKPKNPCPECGAEMEFQPKTWEGDPSLPNGTRDIPAEWTCDCGHHQTERPN